MESYLPWIFGGLLGAGVLLGYYGLQRVRGAERSETQRRVGLWMINFGVVLMAASMALMLWA